VWLTGVSHVGAPEYFAAIQHHLDQQDLVLFEGIHDRAPGQSGRVTVAQGPNSSRGSLQSSMAEALGLFFSWRRLTTTEQIS
jgi:hypothetical protein